MRNLRFTDLQTRALEGLDLPSLPLEEFRPLAPPFEAAFPTPMTAWRVDGQPRTARRYPTSTTCPLPTPADRWWCILTSLHTSPLQVVPGRRCGMNQRQAKQWMHVRLVILRTTLRALGDAPSRTGQALAQRIRVTEAEAAALVVPTTDPRPVAAPPVAAPNPVAAAPLVAMMGRHGASRAPRTRLRRRAVIRARTKVRP
jgi:hypothetical protein